MDGTTYTGTAVYPDDEIEDLEPYTALTFDPPLPAYIGMDAATPTGRDHPNRSHTTGVSGSKPWSWVRDLGGELLVHLAPELQ